jgi:hypothetical protein
MSFALCMKRIYMISGMNNIKEAYIGFEIKSYFCVFNNIFIMKRIIFAFIFMLIPALKGMANDGVFYVNGNEIMPTTSTDIRVDKEILDIKKISDKQVAVSVYYEFYNPGDAKTLQVGFEAMPPQEEEEAAADESVKKKAPNSPQPYMHAFTVMMNDSILTYTNHVEYDKQYGYVSKYIYLFNGYFKPGKNIVRHSYVCDLSMSIGSYYSFYYVLDAAKRWAGGVIDDFTLNIDMGAMQAFGVQETFFKDLNDWTLAGTGKVIDYKKKEEFGTDSVMKCYIRQGCMVFHKRQFRPDSNLSIFCLDGSVTWGENLMDSFDAKNYPNDMFIHVPFTEYKTNPKAKDEFSERVIRNLPYARKGYVFKNKELKDYFNKIEWYLPDPNYKP